MSTATISQDGIYRYDLTRAIAPGTTVETATQPLLVCGLNPSTATADTDDNTIRKEIGFAERWGCDFLIKVNAKAFRATYPEDMLAAHSIGFDVNGPENDVFIRKWLTYTYQRKGIVLLAWGANLSDYSGRQADLARIFERSSVPPKCLGTNKDGSPKHPLYQPYSKALVEWVCP